jgi:3-dehydroquinate dehydratase type I
MVDALKLLAEAEGAGADFVEVRMDCLEETRGLKDLAASTKLPLIATNKLESEKGYFKGIEAERQQTLLDAAQSGFRYIDVDSTSAKRVETVAKIKQLGAKVIVSYHKYDGILNASSLEKILDEEIAVGADVCKIVLTAKQIEDNLSVLSFISFASAKAKLVCFCMGEAGKTSRLLSPALGAFFTFAALNASSQTAAGQMSIKEMKTAYKLLGIGQ